MDHRIPDDVAAGIAMGHHKTTAPFCDRARRCRVCPTDGGDAGTDRSSLKNCLRKAEEGFLPQPRQAVIAEYFCRMRPIRRERSIVRLSVWHITHRRKVEGASCIR